MKIVDVSIVQIATCDAINNLISQVVIFMQSDKTVTHCILTSDIAL